jgi:hypothetical protein
MLFPSIQIVFSFVTRYNGGAKGSGIHGSIHLERKTEQKGAKSAKRPPTRNMGRNQPGNAESRKQEKVQKAETLELVQQRQFEGFFFLVHAVRFQK